MATISIRGIKFRPVFNASGARGFFGEGYWFHLVWRLLTFGVLFNWLWTTFVAKTATFHPRTGNMPLESNGLTPREWLPKCIYIGRALLGITLNAVGLSNRGLVWMLGKRRWQERKEPFFISFMPVETTPEGRLEELRLFLDELVRAIHAFRSACGLQLNLSCPNTGHGTSGLPNEARAWLDEIARRPELASIPVLLKVNVFLRPEDAAVIGTHPRLDGYVCSNTIAWADLSAVGVDQNAIFGTTTSPLAKLGGGGFAGPQMVPVVCRWIRELRSAGYRGTIIGENGIRRPRHAIEMLEAGADGVGIGSMAITRPWMLLPTTVAVHRWTAKRGRAS